MNRGSRIHARYDLERGGFSLSVDIEIPMRGITGVFGQSGCGKTTLLRCMAGLERTRGGFLTVAGDAWQDGPITRPVHEREIGFVFQEPRLFGHLDVRGNLGYAHRSARACATTRSQARDIVWR
jgi:molybdate transport system ATP-binding protein